MKTYQSQTETILKDLKELEIFLPRYQEIAYDIPVQKADVYRNSQELTTAISKRGDDWHKQIDAIIRRKKLETNEIKIKCLERILLSSKCYVQFFFLYEKIYFKGRKIT